MLRACMPCVREPVRACSRMPCGRAGGGDVGEQPDWALGLTLIRQVLIRQVETVGPQDLNYLYYSLGLHVVLTYLVCSVCVPFHVTCLGTQCDRVRP